jgi:hypothetical protein
LLREPLKLQLASLAGLDNRYSPPDVHFQVIAQPDVPIGISSVAVRNDPGRQCSELHFTLKNQTASTLRAIHFLILFFNDRNEPLGGESLTETLNLNPNEDHQVQASLNHFVDSGQRVAVAFTGYKTDTQSWRGDHKAIIESMKGR